jgi:hypothetical protein
MGPRGALRLEYRNNGTVGKWVQKREKGTGKDAACQSLFSPSKSIKTSAKILGHYSTIPSLLIAT